MFFGENLFFGPKAKLNELLCKLQFDEIFLLYITMYSFLGGPLKVNSRFSLYRFYKLPTP